MEGKGRRGGNGRDCRNRIVCTGQYLDIWYGQLMHTTAINFIDKGTPAPVKSTTTQQRNNATTQQRNNATNTINFNQLNKPITTHKECTHHPVAKQPKPREDASAAKRMDNNMGRLP